MRRLCVIALCSALALSLAMPSGAAGKVKRLGTDPSGDGPPALDVTFLDLGGGNNDAGKSSPGSTGGGDSGRVASNSTEASSASEAAEDRTSLKRGEKRTVKSQRPRKKTSGNDEDISTAAERSTRDTSAEEQKPGEGIPIGPFLVGLGLAALIGAAGGKIYAGIMGWRA